MKKSFFTFTTKTSTLCPPFWKNVQYINPLPPPESKKTNYQFQGPFTICTVFVSLKQTNANEKLCQIGVPLMKLFFCGTPQPPISSASCRLGAIAPEVMEGSRGGLVFGKTPMPEKRRHWVGVYRRYRYSVSAVRVAEGFFHLFFFQRGRIGRFYPFSATEFQFGTRIRGRAVVRFVFFETMLNLKTTRSTSAQHENGRRKSAVAANEKYALKTPPTAPPKSDVKGPESYGPHIRRTEAHPRSKIAYPVKKKSPAENCCFSVARRRCRSVSPPLPRTDVAILTQTAKVQTLRPENSAKCKKLLKCNGYPNKVRGVRLPFRISSLADCSPV